MDGQLPNFQFDTLLNDDQELYKWLVTMTTRTGLAKVENAPQREGEVLRLGERVGYLTNTIYGLVFLITSKLIFLSYT